MGILWVKPGPNKGWEALQPVFPEGSILSISFKTTTSKRLLFAFHRSRYSNTGGYQKEKSFTFSSLTNSLNLKRIRTPEKRINHKIVAFKGNSSCYTQQSCPQPKICCSWMSTIPDVALISFWASPSASLVWVKEKFFYLYILFFLGTGI